MTSPSLWKYQLSLILFFNCLVFQSHPPTRNSNPVCVEGRGENGYFLELHNSFPNVDMDDRANSTHYTCKYVQIFENGAKELLRGHFFSPETIFKGDDIKMKRKVRPFFLSQLIYLPFIAVLFSNFLLLHGLKVALRSSEIKVKYGCQDSNSSAPFS